MVRPRLPDGERYEDLRRQVASIVTPKSISYFGTKDELSRFLSSPGERSAIEVVLRERFKIHYERCNEASRIKRAEAKQ